MHSRHSSDILTYEWSRHGVRRKEATKNNQNIVKILKEHLIDNVRDFVKNELANSEFYETTNHSYNESMKRVNYLKHVIENNDGYRRFYINGKPIAREEDIQLFFRLTWYGTNLDVNREVNNGRGPVDYKISMGSDDKCLVEFKLAKNSHLRKNLMKQTKIYEEANQTNQTITVIIFFSDSEEERLINILKELKLEDDKNIVRIDARMNKPSASVA